MGQMRKGLTDELASNDFKFVTGHLSCQTCAGDLRTQSGQDALGNSNAGCVSAIGVCRNAFFVNQEHFLQESSVKAPAGFSEEGGAGIVRSRAHQLTLTSRRAIRHAVSFWATA